MGGDWIIERERNSQNHAHAERISCVNPEGPPSAANTSMSSGPMTGR